MQLRLPKGAPLAQFTRLFRVLVDTVPGVREIISMGKPIQDVWTRSYDLVIVDAPPLGQLFSYLSAPDTISRLVPSGAVRDQAARMRSTLADPSETGLVLVTTLDELPVIETAEAVSRLEAADVIDINVTIANRVLAPLPVPQSAVDLLPPGPLAAAAKLQGRLVASQQRWAEQLGRIRRIPFFFGPVTPTDVVESIVDAWNSP
jgi:anion-transporting  ArsA/GET3 family ATPase